MTDSPVAGRRLLHCVPLESGSQALTMVEALTAALGLGWRHELVWAEGGQAAPPAAAVPPGVRLRADFPSLQGTFGPRRLARLAQAMQPYSLVIGYGWSAIDLAMAHSLYRDALALAPLLHVETGEGWDVQREAGFRRRWYRRLAFGRIAGLVAGNAEVGAAAVRDWQLAPGRIHRITLGIDTSAFQRNPQPDALRVRKRPDECWAGTIATLDRDSDWDGLLSDFAGMPEYWHLVILGEGAARDGILAAALARGISHRVHVPGPVRDHAQALALLDIFLLPPGRLSSPAMVVQAMAAGLPLAGQLAPAIADLPDDANRALIADHPLASQLEELASDNELRRELGAANRLRAQQQFDRTRTIARLRELCQRVAG